jgi:hypothetical protein
MGGYLSRVNALDYRPLFDHLAARASESEQGEPAIACDAARVREGRGLGLVLHLGSPGECVADLVTENRTPTPDHRWVGKTVAVTGQLATTIWGTPLDRFAQQMLVRWAGCDLLPRLTKKTAVLVVADPAEVTGNSNAPKSTTSRPSSRLTSWWRSGSRQSLSAGSRSGGLDGRSSASRVIVLARF